MARLCDCRYEQRLTKYTWMDCHTINIIYVRATIQKWPVVTPRWPLECVLFFLSCVLHQLPLNRVHSKPLYTQMDNERWIHHVNICMIQMNVQPVFKHFFFSFFFNMYSFFVFIPKIWMVVCIVFLVSYVRLANGFDSTLTSSDWITLWIWNHLKIQE